MPNVKHFFQKNFRPVSAPRTAAEAGKKESLRLVKERGISNNPYS